MNYGYCEIPNAKLKEEWILLGNVFKFLSQVFEYKCDLV